MSQAEINNILLSLFIIMLGMSAIYWLDVLDKRWRLKNMRDYGVKAPKTISKSIRLANDVNDYIINFDGNGFNEKFENIILFAMKTEADRKKRLDDIEKLLSTRSEELDKINKDLQIARRESVKYRDVMRSLNSISSGGY